MTSRYRRHLEPITPASWKWTGELPLRIDQEGVAVAWKMLTSAVDGNILRETYAAVGRPLRLSLTVERCDSQRAVIVKPVIKNTGRKSSKPLTRLESLSLSWTAAESPVYVRVSGGGMNEQIYPGNSFRLETQRFDRNGFVKIEHGWDGRSSNRHLPFMMFTAGDDGIVTGLEWSGLWYQCGYGREGRDLHLDAGVPIDGLVLKAGEELSLPAGHAVFANGGLAGASNAWRHYLRECIVPDLAGKRMAPAFAYNHWFGIGPDITEAMMMKEARAAARLGAEYFVLDAGWYGRCSGPNFETGVGNWEIVDKKKFPRGLRPLADAVHGLGMKFGIWFEPERAHRTSDWVRRHPDWFWDTGAPYLHLNLGLRAAQEGMLRVIGKAIEELPAEWVKIDYNFGPKPYWVKADKTGKVMFRYMEGLYRVLDELRTRHPGVVFECCASGGRRIDLGQLRRSHTAWISDQIPSGEICRYMQAGANCFLPGSVNSAGISFGTTEQGVDRTKTGNRLREYDVACRMLGSLTMFGDIASLPPGSIRLLRTMGEAFKSYRHLLDQDFHALLPQPACDNGWEAVEFCTRDGADAVVLVFSGYGPASPTQRVIRPKGLRSSGSYRVTGIVGNDKAGRAVRGGALTADGISVRLGPRSFMGYRIRRV